VKRCSVSIRGTDDEIHTAEFDAQSFFDAANQGIKKWCVFWWYSADQPVGVVSDENRWCVDQIAVKKWRNKNRHSASAERETRRNEITEKAKSSGAS
jgi:hypothetical protein